MLFYWSFFKLSDFFVVISIFPYSQSTDFFCFVLDIFLVVKFPLVSFLCLQILLRLQSFHILILLALIAWNVIISALKSVIIQIAESSQCWYLLSFSYELLRLSQFFVWQVILDDILGNFSITLWLWVFFIANLYWVLILKKFSRLFIQLGSLFN